jgi:hypothetical protein
MSKKSKKPMIGAYAPNPHEGSRSEILADYLFSSWGTVTPVRRPDDYGIDLYCTLSDRIGQRAVVRDYFVVQVKSEAEPWVFEHEESVKWLVEYPTPLFLACIDKKEGILRVYHVTPRFHVWAIGKLPNRLVLTPEDSVEGTSGDWTNLEELSLSAPIIQVSCSDLVSDEKMKTLKEVFKIWVQIDRENCDLVRFGLHRFRVPYSYRVNEAPGGGTVEMGLATPEPEFAPTLLDRGLLTLAECADCIGGQLGRLGDLSVSLRAALLVDHLTTKYPQAFTNSPRWQHSRLTADLATIVVHGLKKVAEDQQASSYLYGALDEVQKALDSHPLVERFLNSRGSHQQAVQSTRTTQTGRAILSLGSSP